MIRKDIYLPQISNDLDPSPSQPVNDGSLNNYPPYVIYNTEYTPRIHKEFDYDKLSRQMFEWNWLVKMPVKWSYNQFQYENLGVFVTDNEQHDNESMNNWVTTTRTIADLVELHHEGKEFIIIQPNDVERIFNIIQEYTEYVAYTFNSNPFLTRRADTNENIQELLSDVIKMQNLANRIFPVMVNLGIDKKEELTGLFGWLTNVGGQTVQRKLEFDPYERYGLSRTIVTDKKYAEPETGLYKALDAQQSFNPETFERIRRFS